MSVADALNGNEPVAELVDDDKVHRRVKGENVALNAAEARAAWRFMEHEHYPALRIAAVLAVTDSAVYNWRAGRGRPGAVVNPPRQYGSTSTSGPKSPGAQQSPGGQLPVMTNEMIVSGKKSDNPAIRRAADRAQKALDDLRNAIQRDRDQRAARERKEREREAAKAEVARLEAELKAARERANKLRSK